MPFSLGFSEIPHMLCFYLFTLSWLLSPFTPLEFQIKGSHGAKFSSCITKGKIQFMTKYEALLEPLEVSKVQHFKMHNFSFVGVQFQVNLAKKLCHLGWHPWCLL